MQSLLFFLRSRLIFLIEKLNRRYSKVGSQPVFSESDFPWIEEIEKEYQSIHNECLYVLENHDIPNLQDVTDDHKYLTKDNGWKTYFLWAYGVEIENNTQICPVTKEVLKKIPHVKTAVYSVFQPQKHVPPHVGIYNGVLRYHLGLIIPKESQKCGIKIDGEVYRWDSGKSLIFDDTYVHEAWNRSQETRVVLFVDFMRPLPLPVHYLNQLAIWLIQKSPDRKSVV